MATTVTVKLLQPFEHHGVTVASVELREPTGALYARLGDPRIVVQNKDGGYYVEQPPVIKQYMDRSIVHQDGAVLLDLMSMPDVMRVKQERFRFFYGRRNDDYRRARGFLVFAVKCMSFVEADEAGLSDIDRACNEWAEWSEEEASRRKRNRGR